MEDEDAGEIPITNQQVSDILSTSIMDKEADIRATAPSSPGTPTSPSAPTTPSPSTTASPAAPTAPAMSISAVAKYYNGLNTAQREELRQQLDMIDSAPAEEPAAPAPTAEGFSRFLGMTL
jgi:hypothetical protein